MPKKVRTSGDRQHRQKEKERQREKRTETSKEDEALQLKNLAKKQNVKQSSENEQPNRNSKQNTTDRAAVIDKRKGKSTHHSSEPEILPKRQKVQELSENKKLKRNPEKNTTDTATVNNETKRKLSHSSNELESFPKKQKLQLSESEKLKRNQDSNDWLTNYFDDQRKRQKKKKEHLSKQQLNNISRRKRRQMPEYRHNENLKRNISRRERRSNAELSECENMSRNLTRAKRRSIPEVKLQENTNRSLTRAKRRSIPEVKLQENTNRNLTRTKRRSIPEIKLQENTNRNLTRAKRCSIPEIKLQENTNRNLTRAKRRSIPEIKLQENTNRNLTRAKRRSIPEIKLQENTNRNLTRAKRRSIPEIKLQENTNRNLTRAKRRSIPEIKLQETTNRSLTRAKRRSLPEIKLQENTNRSLTRAKRRKINEVKENENKKRKEWRHKSKRKENKSIHSKYSKRRKLNNIETQIQIFRDLLKRGDDYVCSCCKQTFYQHSIYLVTIPAYLKKGIPEQFLNQTLTGTKSVGNSEWICKTCYKYIMEKKIPPMAFCNGFKYEELPDNLTELNPTQTEERCVALRIPFMQLKQLGAGKQLGIYGNTVNVPMDPTDVISMLPRRFENTATIHLLFKRRLQYKSSMLHETVRPKVIYDLAKYLIDNSVLYKQEGIKLDTNWLSEIENDTDFASKEDLDTVQNMQNDKNDKSVTACQSHSEIITDKENDDDDRWCEETAEETSGSGNKDTLLQNIDFTDDGRHALQIAPGEKNHPISLYLDQYSEEKAFPVLFAGQKRTENDERQIPVTFSTICKVELRNVDRRFATCVSNIFFKLKKLQTLQVKDIATTALRKTTNNSYTAGQLKSSENINNLLHNDEGFTFLKSLRSSPPYYQSKQKELFAMLRQLGLPTFFSTFSAAETHWLDLLGILAKKIHKREFTYQEIENLNWMERCELIQKDPTTCARHFHYRTQLFLNNIFKYENCPIGKVQDYYIRVEFQQRGSPHLHCLFWMKDSPTYGSSQIDDILQFIDSHISCSSDVSEEDKKFVKLQKHRHSKSCKKKAKRLCRFGFPIPPMTETMILEPLPTDTEKSDVAKHKVNYDKITKVLETLTSDVEMDFNSFLDECKVDYTEYLNAIRSSISKKKVFLKRTVKDTRINSFNLDILRIWQANTDMQYVIDPYAVCVYIASYIMKSQRGMSMLLQNAVQEVKQGNLSIREKLRVISNKFLNHCEISAQEAIYLLLQLPLTQSSRDVIFINTSPPEKRIEILKPASVLKGLPDDSTDITCTGLIQRYSERPPSIENMTLAHFASDFDRYTYNRKGLKEPVEEVDMMDNNIENIVAGTEIPLPDGSRLVKRRTSKIIRYVKYSLKKDPELHYREQLMLFHPWREELLLMGTSSSFEEQYKKFENTIVEVRQTFSACISDCNMDEIMENVSQEIVNDEMDNIAPTARQTEEDSEEAREDNISLLQPPNETSRNYDIGLDIGCPGKTTNEIVIQNKLSDIEYRELVRSLNNEQKTFFYYILHLTKTTNKPYHVFLSGGAGVGKSHALRAVYQAVMRFYDTAGENPDELKVVIGAPTGKAAYNIKGNTLHSIFSIPASHSLKTYMPLDHSTLNTLRCRFIKLRLLIIDEISMVGIHMFNFINNRLQEIFCTKEAFGGISLLLVGDLFQLRPVLDQWIFTSSSSDYGPLMPNFWTEQLQFFELKTVMRQKDDAEFAHLLNRVREGEQNDADIQTLLRRLVNPSEHLDLSKFIHLYSSNALVDQHNETALANIDGPMYISEASDYTLGEASANVKSTVLEIAKSQPPQKTQNLLTELQLKVSAHYMMIQNVDIKDGLTNGASCQLMHVELSNNKPILLWVLFSDQEDIGSDARKEYRHLYKSNINRTWTPVHFLTRQFQVGKYKTVHVMRKQFPLKPAAASTVHKCQGISLSNAVISFKGRIQSHMVYVALSRVTSLQGLHLLDFDHKKITIDKTVSAEISRLRSHCQIVYKQLPSTKSNISIVCHNARSLHKHIDEYRNDARLQQIDFIFILETWAQRCDPLEYYRLQGFHSIEFYSNQQTPHRPHCGIFVYIKNDKSIDNYQFIQAKGMEGIKITLQNADKPLIITCVYCHPTANIDTICEKLNSIISPVNTNILIGDFNIDQLKQTLQLKKLLSTTNNLQLESVHSQETTNYHSCIDHSYITKHHNYEYGLLECYWSDHKLQYLFI